MTDVIIGADAERHFDELCEHYDRLGRAEAIRNLIAAVELASKRIGDAPASGLPAPKPYPQLAREGRMWMKEGRYWFFYSCTVPPSILGIFFETADLPTRATSLSP